MAKAAIKLPNGTTVTIEGTSEEVHKLLELYTKGSPQTKVSHKTKQGKAKGKARGEQVDLAEIVNLVKDCDEAEAIEREILDRISQVNRALLPLYIVHEHIGNKFSLKTGEISKVTTDLGIPIAGPNVSRTLSGTAARYVMGDKVRKRGQPVRYKLSRRGVKYLKEILKGTKSGK